VLFVDDGSTDGTWRILEDLCQKNDQMHAIRLSRNFGSHVALTAGIDHAEGDAVATLACDLQDPPEVVLEFVERWKSGAQVVWGVRRSRTDSWLRSRISELFTILLRRFALPAGSQFATGSFLLLDRLVVECFRKFREHNRITFALVAWSGFDQASVLYDRTERIAGSSSWTASRLWKVGYDALIGFSPMPARLMTFTGLLTFIASIIATVYLVFTYFSSDVMPGWTGLMVTITFFFGVLFMMVGIVAEYLHRIFLESTQRPLYFVSRKLDASTRR
jgi:glycosyltransferase involved in cell wall biosynthesis